METTKTRVLVADDDDVSCQGFAMSLATRYDVKTANTLEDVRRKLCESDFAVMIIDYSWGGKKNCTDLVKTMRVEHPDVAIIIFSGQAELADLAKLCNEGEVRGFITKEAPDHTTTIMFDTACALIERAKLDRLLKGYIDPLLRKAIRESEGEILRPAATQVVVLFMDLRGFTTICRELSVAKKLVPFLTAYFEEAERIIHQHRGIIDKFIGDAVMALFGLLGGNDGVVGAVRDGLAAAEALRGRIEQLLHEHHAAWAEAISNVARPHVGIALNICNVGEDGAQALVGNIGTPRHLQFTVIGREVNDASRLVDLARPGEILITTTVKARLTEVRVTRDVNMVQRAAEKMKGNVPPEALSYKALAGM